MTDVIDNPQVDALVSYFNDALRENIENGALALPSNDGELRDIATGLVACLVDQEQFFSSRFGRFLTSETARSELKGITHQALTNYVDNNSLLRVKTADAKEIYPELQFDGEGSIVPGLAKIFQILLPVAADEWTVLYWLTAPLHPYGNRTAIEVLRDGNAREAEAILELAQKDASVWQSISR